MNYNTIEQIDSDGVCLEWIAIEEQDARDLFEVGHELYFVTNNSVDLIQNEEDLEDAIEANAVCPDESHSWKKLYEDGVQNRARNNNHISFEEWLEIQIGSYY